jgi:hypothetical protein
VVYEQNFGAIPPKCLVTFIDGNTLICAPENLKLLTSKENMRKNVNYEKTALKMKSIWKTERLRKKYGLSPITKFGNHIK